MEQLTTSPQKQPTTKTFELNAAQQKILTDLDSARSIIEQKQQSALAFALAGFGVDPASVAGIEFTGGGLVVTFK